MKHRGSITFLVISTLIVAVGCDLLSSESEGTQSLHIQTDKEIYSFSDDEFIEVNIINRSLRTFHYSTCFGKTIEVLRDGKVKNKIGLPICYCICPAELKPGRQIDNNISRVSIREIRRFADTLHVDQTISYRIRYQIYSDKVFGNHSPPADLPRSNEFKIIQ